MQRCRNRAIREPALLAFILFFFFCIVPSVGWVAASFCQSGASSSHSKGSGRSDLDPRTASLPQVREPQEPRPSEQEIEMERKREIARKKQNYEDTKKLADQLLKTVQDLKSSIDKAGENTLPLDAVKKTDEIESLAKKIKSKLKGVG